ncbi:hypothetical protein DPMN_163132 [Dreissena polymorpha]|uniref:Uncharacterized protein n=1 Tax=Dreissena polymorpha TaxID=45954 RepID=A0A9D4EQM0_DREPO|nr:hypothetical protein DPMN_163132 [Dreissena polymorpha]
MQNSKIINQIQLSEADLECISQTMHVLFKADLENIVRSVVQAFIPQVITGINASLNDIIESLTRETTQLKNPVAELLCQADRAETYSRRNCLRITGIPEARDEDTDNIIVTMAKDLGAELSIDEIDRSQRVGTPKYPGQRARDIIVKFVSYRARQQKLYSMRSRAKHSDRYKGKFINESLTKLRSDFFLTRASYCSINLWKAHEPTTAISWFETLNVSSIELNRQNIFASPVPIPTGRTHLSQMATNKNAYPHSSC